MVNVIQRYSVYKTIFRHLRRTCSFNMINDSSTSETQKRQSPKTIGTHNGTFHCDEVLACYMLRQLPEYKNARILRSRNIEELHKECDIIVDVGDVFDHNRRLYDHHQREFSETLSTLKPELGTEFNIKLSSAGLIYCFYGEQIISSILKKYNISLSQEDLLLSYVQIYQGFMKEIDAIDNGVPLIKSGDEPSYTIHTHLSARIGKINLRWDEEISDALEFERFEKAMHIAGEEFNDKVLNICGSWIKARQYVRQALEQAKSVYPSGEILILEKFCPWKVHLFDLEKELKVEGIAKLLIFIDQMKQWRVIGVPQNPDSFIGRKFLPIAWRGLRNDALSKIAGIDSLTFVHHSGFTGGAETREAALEMAIKSVEWKED